jgi:AhpD family alkylhydroperoxidase
MSERIEYTELSPEGVEALGDVYDYVTQSGLSDVLVELVYLRVSQINGCAYCVDMHTRPLMSWRKRRKEVMRIPLLIAGAVAMTAVFAQSESNSIRSWTNESVNERDPFTNSENTP